MTPPIQPTTVRRWAHGPAGMRRAVERWLTDGGGELLAANARRRIHRIPGPNGRPLLVKQFLATSGLRALRDPIKAWLGRSPDRREWEALRRLHAHGVPCPQPFARAWISDGSRLIVREFLEGESIAEVWRRTPSDRRALLHNLGSAAARLHEVGFVHGDLHVGNFLVTRDGPVVFDLQRARATSRTRPRLRDLGSLDFSLRLLGASQSDRMRFRRAALASAGSDRVTDREALRHIGDAALRRAHTWARNRTRRSGRPSALYPRIRVEGGEGLRVSHFPESAVRAAIVAHRALNARTDAQITDPIGRAVSPEGPAILKRDHRAIISAVAAEGRFVVVKEVTKGGWLRRLADGWRGSPARRGWIGGHGLDIRGIRAARPLAYTERRIAGVPMESLLICEDLRRYHPLSELNHRTSHGAEPASSPLDGEPLVESLWQLVLRLHRRGIHHGDLQAIHVYLDLEAGTIAPLLIDLDGVHFSLRVNDATRIADLAVLNASLGDSVASDALRLQAFERYARSLPFACGRREALARAVRISRDRQHVWTGRDCELSRPR